MDCGFSFTEMLAAIQAVLMAAAIIPQPPFSFDLLVILKA